MHSLKVGEIIKALSVRRFALSLMPHRAGLKSKILLSQIAERNHNGSRYNLCNRRIYMKLFNEQADENIVQDYAD